MSGVSRQVSGVEWKKDKDSVINCVEHICQVDLKGIVDYRVLSAGDETLDILHGWKKIHLRKIE